MEELILSFSLSGIRQTFVQTGTEPEFIYDRYFVRT